MMIILPLAFAAYILMLFAMSISRVSTNSFNYNESIKNTENRSEKDAPIPIITSTVENIERKNIKNISRIAIIQKIQEAIKANNRMFPECHDEEISEYIKDTKSFLNKKFERWIEDDVEDFRYYCDCGVNKLQMYAKYYEKTDMDAATDMIYHVDDKILRYFDYKRAEEQSIFYWDFAICFTRLLICYEYLGNDELVDNKLICHTVVNRLTNVLNNDFYSTEDWMSHNAKKVVYLNISRLLTNYLYSKNKFEAMIDNDAIDLIKKFIPQLQDQQYKHFYLDSFRALEMHNY